MNAMCVCVCYVCVRFVEAMYAMLVWWHDYTLSSVDDDDKSLALLLYVKCFYACRSHFVGAMLWPSHSLYSLYTACVAYANTFIVMCGPHSTNHNRFSINVIYRLAFLIPSAPFSPLSGQCFVPQAAFDRSNFFLLLKCILGSPARFPVASSCMRCLYARRRCLRLLHTMVSIWPYPCECNIRQTALYDLKSLLKIMYAGCRINTHGKCHTQTYTHIMPYGTSDFSDSYR